MNEAALSALLGSAQIQSISTGAAAQNTSQVPAGIATLPTGSLIKGFVVNRDTHNNPVLRTDKGDVLVKSEVFLKTGSEVVIRVNQQANQQQARIISVDGQSIQQVQQQQDQAAKMGQQDRVMQSSMMPSNSSSNIPTTVASTTSSTGFNQPMTQPTVTLDAIMLKPNASSANPNMQQNIASMLKLPDSALHVLEKGAALQFKVLSSQLNLTAPLTNTATPTTVAGSIPQQITPSTTSAQYQAYSQVSGTTNTTPPLQSGQNVLPPATTTANPASAIGQTITPQNTAQAIANLNAAASSSTLPEPPAGQQATPTTSSTQTAMPSALTPTAGTGATATPAPLSSTPVGVPASTTPATSNTAAPLTNTPLTGAGVISASVIGVEPSGETIVRTPIGTIKLFTASPPPLHSVLQIALVVPSHVAPSNIPPSQNTPVPTTVSTFSALSHDWQALREAHQLLAQSNQAMAQEFAGRIPNTKSKMVNSVLFFLSALKSGDMKHWMGSRNIAELEAKSPNLMKRLGGDFDGVRSLSGERTEQSWQMLVFPLMHEDELNQVRCFYKEDESGGKDEENGSRFVIEVSMSEIGEIQLDGLIRKPAGKLQFDLIVHSVKTLSDVIQTDIQSIFEQAADVGGFTGSIRFEPDPERFIHPLQDIQQRYDPDDDKSILA